MVSVCPVAVSLLVGVIMTAVHPATSNQSPLFVNWQESSPLSVRENTSVGTTIGKLSAIDADSTILNFEVVGDLAKQIVMLVRVTEKEMDIVLASPLDYEVVKDFTIMYQVSDEDNFVRKVGFLYIIDVNDNPPTFVNLPYRAEIPENAPPGVSVFSVLARDPDQGFSGLVSYNITTPQSMFSINVASGQVDLVGELDYETEKFYQLEIMAMDRPQGSTPLNSTTDLIINIMDIQDTAPYFTNLPYIESVYENATVGTLVVEVRALDGDRGVPNPVNYSFTDVDETVTSYFSIDAATGDITVTAPIDREDPAILAKSGVIEYTILVQEITDAPTGPTMTTAPVTIRVLDVNDQSPTFSEETYTATVLENTQARIPVTMELGTELVVRDMDQGDNGRFELFLETQNGQPFDVFEPFPKNVINEANVLLRVRDSAALDYETVKSFTFYILARETDSIERQVGRALVTVSLVDVNDNFPVFDETNYEAKIWENTFLNTPVITITASDADSGDWGEISYSLRGTSAHLFTVDPSSGAVVVAVAADQDLSLLDREKQAILYLTVEAVDGGGLRSSTQLAVTLDDRNDNAPAILRAQYDGYIDENKMELELPVVVEAVDIDQGPFNNEIVYSIVGGNPYQNFTIDRTTGKVGLNRYPLNYESMDPALDGRIELTVQARDLGSPPMESTAIVIINVQDVNDEWPYFLNPPYFATLPENATQGTNVTQVSANDLDGTAPNNEIIFRIESGASDNFRIAADTGLITVETGADLDREEYGSFYNLKVIAIDKGTPSLTGTTDVNITITDVNNKSPFFTVNPLHIEVEESQPLDTVLETYTAFDPDETALLKYTRTDKVIGQDEDGNVVDDPEYVMTLFGVHLDTGEIYINSSLDREIVERVVLEILVTDVNADVNNPVQTATGTVTISLLDVNDNPPAFQPSNEYSVRLSEAAKPGVEVARVVAVDPDRHDGPVRYDIVYDTFESYSFLITNGDRYRGIITLGEAVDRELNDVVNLTVMATDAGFPGLNSTAKVSIAIEDINDNAPEWILFNTTVTVWENATVGTEVAVVTATDVDDGEFGRVMYFIISGDHGLFGVTNDTGVVFVAAPLDRETLDELTLTIEARDNNLAPQSQQRKTPNYMAVTVRDVNDNVPVFSAGSYAGSVTENILPGTPVTAVMATDDDQGDNGRVRYIVNITAGNDTGIFDVDAVTGQVYVARSLQGRHGDYVMVVIATDLGAPPRQNVTNVYISVDDVNDHPPIIYQPAANETINVRENLAPGSLVIRILATDEDLGENGVVNYRLTEAGTIEDWKKFSINTTSGELYNSEPLDREEQEVYTLEVIAYDLGSPRYEDRRTLTVVLLDEDDNPPVFDHDTLQIPYLVYVREETAAVAVANLDIATDPDSGNNSIICYFLVGGDELHIDKFDLNTTSGDLRLNTALDRETTPQVSLVVKATDVCHPPPPRGTPWDPQDPTLLLVAVTVQDVNDNAPTFTRGWFTAGVTKDTQHGAEVLQLKDYSMDADIGSNALLSYAIRPPFRFSSGLQDQFDSPPFVVGPRDGVVYTDVYFQEDMQGYIEFVVTVADGAPGHVSTANVSVYLLHQEQRVKVVLLGTTDEVGGFKDIFASFLSNITGAIINVDMIQTHKDSQGDPDPTRTDMFIHGIYPQTGQVMESKVLIEIIDSNYPSLVDLFKKYNVIEVVPAVPVVTSSTEEILQLALILVAVILGLLTIVIIIGFCLWRRRYKRKLRAATASAYGPHDTGLNKLEMPGTNVHAYEGSNPIWLEQYEQGWPKDSDSDSKNSIDENALEPPPTRPDPATRGSFDEQEMSLEMYNDEYDHYNKNPAGGTNQAGDAYLKEALRDHRSNNLNRVNGNSSHSNGSVNGGVRNVEGYDNVGYVRNGVNLNHDDLEATEI